MLRLVLLFSVSLPLVRAEAIDNVLIQLVPRDTTTLFGARMEQIKSAPLYRKLVIDQKLPQLDDFARETGFDPRRDVRELLIASGSKQKSGLLLARGSFHIASLKDAKRSEYRGYAIWSHPKEDAGFCVLDATLAIAGPVYAMHAALDQYKGGSRQATALVARAMAAAANEQLWAVSLGSADFIANNLPPNENTANFSRIFRSLEDTRFGADLSRGLRALAQGDCRTEADAKNLLDAARGLIGFGRLSVPDNQPQLLRVWDAIQVEQQARRITISANLQQDQIDKLLDVFTPRK